MTWNQLVEQFGAKEFSVWSPCARAALVCTLMLGCLAAAVPVMGGGGASIVVAASDSPSDVKAKADLVCTGTHDEVVLLQSIMRAPKFPTSVDTSPAGQTTVTCYGRCSVLWLPGNYYLDSTLTIPDGADMVISAQGSYMHYRQKSGDAVVVRGMMRCRYRFGTIESGSTGAALRFMPIATMPEQMSETSFTGLIGSGQQGTGLYIDPSVVGSGISTNKFEGTDIGGFDVGVRVADASGKCDTNHFWVSYIRRCNMCVWESQHNVDSNIWTVNVDASIPNSTAIRTGALYGKWTVIMGAFGGSGTTGILLDPGARYNTFEVPQSRAAVGWTYVDHSGNTTNQLISPSN